MRLRDGMRDLNLSPVLTSENCLYYTETIKYKFENFWGAVIYEFIY